MALRSKEYGKAKGCEYGDCETPRGAPERCIMSYGCVLCVFHEDEYQLGKISLPDTASDDRKQQATESVLG